MTPSGVYDIAVVGAGPAGLAAALAARSRGARVVVIDCFAKAGGQYFVQPAQNQQADIIASQGQKEYSQCRAAGVEFLLGHEIFAAYPGFHLLMSGDGRGTRVSARAVIAASGAHERNVAFPGWTLPGVMNAGAGQRLLKAYGVRPGQRVVIAGSGIFLWAVAKTFLQHGIEIVAFVEARRPGLKMLRHFAVHPERWGDAAALMGWVYPRLGKTMWGHMIGQATGEQRVECVTVVPTGGGPAKTFEGIDALLVSHGFQPNVELTSLLGCRHLFDDAIGGWHVEVDDNGQTSVAGLFAAGEVTGIAGASPAILSGTLSGHAAADYLSLACEANIDMPVLKAKLKRARSFGHGLMRLFSPLPELQSVQRDDTILCRCEEVTRRDVLSACQDGAKDLHALKTWTRAGMGRCQGRMCRMSVSACMADALGQPLEAIQFNQPRLPLRPTPIDHVLAASEGIHDAN